MIVTVTLNPSMDSIYFTDTFTIGKMNRCNNPIKAVGGKGINAGRTAAILGSEVQTIGVLAGMNGEFIQKELAKELFQTHFLSISGESRNAVTVMDHENNQTEIVELGPQVEKDVAEQVIDLVIQTANRQATAPVIALCGSANTQNSQLYKEYLEHLKKKLKTNVKILTDISGLQLKNVLHSSIKPYFIKPNIHEFSELLHLPIENKADIVKQLSHSLLKDIPFVLVSCGNEGAIAKYQNRIFDIKIPKIKVINPTGSGDATVGGVAFALDNGYSIEDILRYGMACGISNALEKKVGYVTKNKVEELKNEIQIQELT